MQRISPADSPLLILPDLDALARETRFVIRESSKMEPSAFLQTLCGAVASGFASHDGEGGRGRPRMSSCRDPRQWCRRPEAAQTTTERSQGKRCRPRCGGPDPRWLAPDAHEPSRGGLRAQAPVCDLPGALGEWKSSSARGTKPIISTRPSTGKAGNTTSWPSCSPP